jgi:hypothetical protein
MRLRHLVGLGTVLVAIAAGVPAAASALTLGSLATSDPGACGVSGGWIIQTASTTAPYVVPAGGGVITSWSTSFGTAGSADNLLVARPSSGGYTALALDQETLPTPIPPGNVSTFTLAHPIAVEAGDLIGLAVPTGSGATCYRNGAAAGDAVAAGTSPPSVGNPLVVAAAAANILTNVSVNLSQQTDLAISGSGSPSAVTTGDNAIFSFSVTATPAGAGTFTDQLPAGLTPAFVNAGTNPCTITGQLVSCSLTQLPVTVSIAVRGASPGTYTDNAEITNAVTDTNPANNTAAVTLGVVNKPPTPQCTVPKLKGAPLAVAKSVLPLVNCKVGKVTKAKSKSVAKGDVISTKPGGGKKLAAGTKVAIKTSSGKPKKTSKKK